MKKLLVNIISSFFFTFIMTIHVNGLMNNGMQALSKAQLTESIRTYVKKQLPKNVERFKIEIKNLPDSISVPSGYLQINIERSNKTKIKGNIVLRLLVTVNQQLIDKITTTVKIITFENVLIARQKIARHKIIDDADIAVESRQTTKLHQKFFHTTEQVCDFRAKYHINKGNIITENMLESIPLIKRGEIVTLIVQTGRVCVSTLGKALADGFKDEIINVKNLDTKKRLKGKVVAEKRVLIIQ